MSGLNPAVWGPAVAAAVKAVGIAPGTPITDAQLQAVWTAITNQHDIHVSANAVVTVSVPLITAGLATAAGTGTVT